PQLDWEVLQAFVGLAEDEGNREIVGLEVHAQLYRHQVTDAGSITVVIADRPHQPVAHQLVVEGLEAGVLDDGQDVDRLPGPSPRLIRSRFLPFASSEFGS